MTQFFIESHIENNEVLIIYVHSICKWYNLFDFCDFYSHIFFSPFKFINVTL